MAKTYLGGMLSSFFGGKKGSRSTLSSFVPFAPHEYGQPRPDQLDSQGTSISVERMREVANKTPTVAACKNAILDYLQGVKIKIRNVDPAQVADPAKVAHVMDFMNSPNGVDTWRRFLLKIADDLVTLGSAAVEIEPASDGSPANLNVLDGARMYIDFGPGGQLLGYDMRNAYGIPEKGSDGVHAWNPEEIIYFIRNPQTKSLYGYSQLQQLFSCAILEDMMLAFIGGKFDESNVPFGIYDLGDITDDELDRAVQMWNEQTINAQHRIILTGSKQGGKWNIFGYHLKDLEAVQLLSEIRGRMMAVMGVTMNELGESQDVNKSNGYNLSFTFKKRAIEPPLDEICGTLTKRFLWDTLGYKDLEYFFEEIDSRDELLAAQIDDLYWKMGVLSPNAIRNRRGDPSMPGGDVLGIMLGNAFVPLDLLVPMAEAQLSALKAAAQAGQSPDGTNGSIKPPLIKGPQTPKSEYNEQPRIHYQVSKPARGPVEANQRAGLRKDN